MQNGATEVMISRTKRQTWESRFRSQPRGHMHDLGELSGAAETLRRCSDSAACLIARDCCMCAWLCVSVSRSKADVSSGEETLEIGYCITGAIYLFWGLTYLIPPLNPVGVNSLAFQMI